MIGRIAITGAAVLALAFPAAAAAKPGHGPAKRAAVKACLKERSESGRSAFVASYGRPAMKRCVRQTLPEARNAVEECRDERREDPEAFVAEHGTNHNGRNAFGKCVSGKVNGDGHEDEAESSPEETGGDPTETGGEESPGTGEELPDGGGEESPPAS